MRYIFSAIFGLSLGVFIGSVVYSGITEDFKSAAPFIVWSFISSLVCFIIMMIATTLQLMGPCEIPRDLN